MALQTFVSDQKADGYRKRPYEDMGKLRIEYFNVAAVAVLGDTLSLALLCTLPPGAIRVLPHLSRLTSSAFGASRVLAIGHGSYQSRDSSDSSLLVAANYSAFGSGIDNSSAITTPAAIGASLKYDLYSKTGVDVYAQVSGGTWPAAGTIAGYIIFIAE